MLFSNGPNKVFLVPNSCRATIRNGNSIMADAIEDTIEKDRTTLVSALFRQFGSGFELFGIAD